MTVYEIAHDTLVLSSKRALCVMLHEHDAQYHSALLQHN